MAADAGVGPAVEVFHVAHADGDAHGMVVIRPGVSAKPVFRQGRGSFRTRHPRPP
jgi:hypothetical protein